MHDVPGLACPACRGDLRAQGEAKLTCDSCGAGYPILDDIPSFVPGSPGGRQSRYELTVLIPASNQAHNLDRLLPTLRHELRSLEISHEILVVDASPGYGAALRAGFEHALGEYVLTLDADGSHDPSFLRAVPPGGARGHHPPGDGF